MAMSKKLTAEFIGTFWLVLGGCGAAVLAAAFPALLFSDWATAQLWMFWVAPIAGFVYRFFEQD